MGTLRVVYEIIKTAPSDIVQAHSSDLLRIVRYVDSSKGFETNAVIRKLRTKAIAHVGIRLLPPRGVLRVPRGEASVTGTVSMNLILVIPEGKSLVPPTIHNVLRTEDGEVDVPEETDAILGDLFQAIQDKVSTLNFPPAI